MISRRTPHLKVDSKAQKSLMKTIIHKKIDSIVSFMTFYYVSKTIVYLDNNIREWNKVPEKHQFGIYIIIFNNTAKTRIFFWMNIISRKTEHKTLNARKMNTNFKNQIT